MKNFLITLFVFLILIAPALSLAQSPIVNPSGTGIQGGLVPCNNNTQAVTNSDGSVTPPVPCDFNQAEALINNIITFILFYMALPIAALSFAWAGFLLVKAQGGEAKNKAKEIFANTVYGLLFAAGAWIIVSTILSILGYEGAWLGLKF